MKIKLERYDITFNEEEFKNVLTPLNFYRDGKFLYKRSPSKILYENHILPKQSTGEEYITLLLETNNIEFESQKTFNDLFDKGPLKFDFFIVPNIFIEFNGSQHKNGDSLFYSETTVLHDNMKVDYVTNNNYNMLIIEKENNHSLTKKEREMIQKKSYRFYWKSNDYRNTKSKVE